MEGGGPQIPPHSPKVSHSRRAAFSMDTATLATIKDKLPIIKRIKKKRSWMTMEHPSYAEEEEIPLEED